LRSHRACEARRLRSYGRSHRSTRLVPESNGIRIPRSLAPNRAIGANEQIDARRSNAGHRRHSERSLTGGLEMAVVATGLAQHIQRRSCHSLAALLVSALAMIAP